MKGKWTAVALVAAGVLLAVLSVFFRATSPIPRAPVSADQPNQHEER